MIPTWRTHQTKSDDYEEVQVGPLCFIQFCRILEACGLHMHNHKPFLPSISPLYSTDRWHSLWQSLHSPYCTCLLSLSQLPTSKTVIMQIGLSVGYSKSKYLSFWHKWWSQAKPTFVFKHLFPQQKQNSCKCSGWMLYFSSRISLV